MSRLRFVLLVLCVSPRLLAECSLSGGINAPQSVVKYSGANVVTAAPDYGVEPLVKSWTWTVSGGTITSISTDQKTMTFSIQNPGPYVYIRLLMSDDAGCTRDARSAAVAVVDPPPLCPSLTVDPVLSAPAAATTRTIAVQATCEWSVTGLPHFVTVLSGSSGNGNGTILLSVQRNSGAQGRTGVIRVNEQEIAFYQQGLNSIYPDYNNDGRTDLLWRYAGGAPGIVFTSYMSGVTTNGGRWITGEANASWHVYPSYDWFTGMSDLYWVGGAGAVKSIDMKHVSNGYGVTDRWGYTSPAVIGGFLGNYSSGSGMSTTSELYVVTSSGEPVQLHSNPYINPPFYTQPAGWELIGVADIDGNLREDYLFRHLTDGRLFAALRGNEPENILASGVFHAEPNLQWQVVATGDVNGDGRADLIWRNMTDGRIWTQWMNGFSWTGGGVVWTEPDPHWVLKASGDFDGDGRADLLFRNDLTGIVFVVLLDGNSVVGSGISHYEPNMNWRLAGPTTTPSMLRANSSQVP